ncbi:MAG: tRNA (adenosine(37)-N6)-threonylcarbamoyltransferase complex ATPase subunit type 1 TsaE [Gammaproteobacteria bacterium]|nr:tRNA (adenosine(37)-N6)-threonylcarbamoyltransferase complex ATPase subunit type 1 TsaE [Gammaproteobacteria bacterium]
MKMLELHSDSATITESFAKVLAQCCETRPLVIYLRGELGAGKTTFCRGFIHGLGHEGNVKSPTYTMVEPYQLSGLTVYHFDLYRIGSYKELEEMGVRDYFNGQSLCLIEWPERAEGELVKADISVALAYVGDERKLTIEAQSTVGKSVLKCFSQMTAELENNMLPVI